MKADIATAKLLKKIIESVITAGASDQIAIARLQAKITELGSIDRLVAVILDTLSKGNNGGRWSMHIHKNMHLTLAIQLYSGSLSVQIFGPKESDHIAFVNAIRTGASEIIAKHINNAQTA